MTQSLETPTEDKVESAIRQVALDYIEGWYDGDSERMEHSLHPHLAKRIVIPNGKKWGSGDRLDEMSALSLVQATRHESVPMSGRRTDVRVLDCFEDAACVRVDAKDWIDYMHLAKWNGHWKIVNVLWVLRPGTN